MAFKVIRVSGDCQVVILVTPPEAGPDDPDKTLYEHNGYRDRDDEGDFFTEISTESAVTYFSGIADGMGRGETPEPFDTLEAAEEWTRGKQQEHDDAAEVEARTYLEERGIPIPDEE